MAAKRISNLSYGANEEAGKGERIEAKAGGQDLKKMIVMEQRVYANTCSLRTSAYRSVRYFSPAVLISSACTQTSGIYNHTDMRTFV